MYSFKTPDGFDRAARDFKSGINKVEIAQAMVRESERMLPKWKNDPGHEYELQDILVYAWQDIALNDDEASRLTQDEARALVAQTCAAYGVAAPTFVVLEPDENFDPAWIEHVPSVWRDCLMSFIAFQLEAQRRGAALPVATWFGDASRGTPLAPRGFKAGMIVAFDRPTRDSALHELAHSILERNNGLRPGSKQTVEPGAGHGPRFLDLFLELLARFEPQRAAQAREDLALFGLRTEPWREAVAA